MKDDNADYAYYKVKGVDYIDITTKLLTELFVIVLGINCDKNLYFRNVFNNLLYKSCKI